MAPTSLIMASSSITPHGTSTCLSCEQCRIAMPAKLAAAVLTFSVAACTSVGPGTVPHDRVDYANAIGNSWKEQTLLNIVKLRYGDMPIFLEVAQVIAGYQLQSALSGSFTLGNFTSSLIDRLTATGGATAASTYTDRPTVVYQPLTGVEADDANSAEFSAVHSPVGLFRRSHFADYAGCD